MLNPNITSILILFLDPPSLSTFYLLNRKSNATMRKVQEFMNSDAVRREPDGACFRGIGERFAETMRGAEGPASACRFEFKRACVDGCNVRRICAAMRHLDICI